MSYFMKKGKAYGLIMPPGKKSTVAKPVSKLSAFGDSSSDEEDDGRRHVNVSLKKEHEKRKNQMDETASRALAEDPSVFEYDSVYDQMVEEKKKKISKFCSERKPKYIHALKRAAERRKLEGELVYEHQAQKDIEKDAEMYKDKESFVTSAYKKKLEERRELEEELAREAAIEAENDVTKQKDLSRFQKHLFNQVASGGGSGEGDSKQPQVSDNRRGSERDSVDSRSEKGSGDRDERRRKSSESEGRGGRERRLSSGGSRERERGDSERRDRDRRWSSDRDRYHRERSGHRERRRSREQEKSPEQTKSENTSIDDKPTDKDAKKTDENEGESLPPKKKMTIRAGIEVEEDEITPVERRKQAATKKATGQTTQSARERYLTRKRAKTEAVARKPSTADE